MKRSRSGQVGSVASYFRNLVNSTVATSAAPMGRPGWPDLAVSTASIARTRTAFARSEWVTRSAETVSCTARSTNLEGPATGRSVWERCGLLNTGQGGVKGSKGRNPLPDRCSLLEGAHRSSLNTGSTFPRDALVSCPNPGGMMAPTLDEAMKRLDMALGLLEASVSRRMEADRRRGGLETELQLMQDDRARLAVELDGALTRMHRFEAATDDVSRRVRQAIGAVETVLAQAGQLAPAGQFEPEES